MNESAEQKSLLRWWHMAHRGLGVPDARLLFAIPNGAYLGGGKPGARRGARLRGEGLVAGVPDLFLAYPREIVVDGVRWACPGLFIEMKRAKGGAWSEAQREVAALLVGQGFAFKLCRGWPEAARQIESYLRP